MCDIHLENPGGWDCVMCDIHFGKSCYRSLIWVLCKSYMRFCDIHLEIPVIVNVWHTFGKSWCWIFCDDVWHTFRKILDYENVWHTFGKSWWMRLCDMWHTFRKSWCWRFCDDVWHTFRKILGYENVWHTFGKSWCRRLCDVWHTFWKILL